MLFLLTAGVRAQAEPEFINDAPPGFLHIRTKVTETWTEDQYFACDKVTSVSLQTMTVNGEPQCRVRIVTQEFKTSDKVEPVTVNLPLVPKKEAETLMLQIINVMRRK